EIDRSESAGQQTVTFAAGPVRDFYLAASSSYEVVSRTVGQVTINSYAPANLLAGAEVALDQAAQAVEHFNRRFGPYPFTEFDLVGTTNFALGIEYPGIVAILLDLYDQVGQVRGQATPGLLESVVAHEVAHQWFYSLVGNDQIDEPWLDEALAQYATILYYNDGYDEQAAAGFRRSLERRWARVGQAEIPIGLPVRDYSVDEYSGIIYGRGPLFIAQLAETMGQPAFDEFLQDYATTYRWRIATGDDFKRLAEQHCQCDLNPLFAAWVNPK
ncbi:MAG: M1 family peptidase, partial [Anaerolineae bacterium]|nr:M1 family peptidase [Anaerolineae bacterium]